MLVEGGSQNIAAILSDFYAPTFKAAFEDWLQSVPDYPKPFEFRMETIADLLNMNVKSLFKTTGGSTKQGCEAAM